MVNITSIIKNLFLLVTPLFLVNGCYQMGDSTSKIMVAIRDADVIIEALDNYKKDNNGFYPLTSDDRLEFPSTGNELIPKYLHPSLVKSPNLESPYKKYYYRDYCNGNKYRLSFLTRKPKKAVIIAPDGESYRPENRLLVYFSDNYSRREYRKYAEEVVSEWLMFRQDKKIWDEIYDDIERGDNCRYN